MTCTKKLIALHKAVQSGWAPPSVVTEEDYKQAKQAEDHLKVFIGFGCSFSGKYFGGYARCKRGDNYALQSANSLIKKHQNMKDVRFFNLNYSEVNIPVILWYTVIYPIKILQNTVRIHLITLLFILGAKT